MSTLPSDLEYYYIEFPYVAVLISPYITLMSQWQTHHKKYHIKMVLSWVKHHSDLLEGKDCHM